MQSIVIQSPAKAGSLQLYPWRPNIFTIQFYSMKATALYSGLPTVIMATILLISGCRSYSTDPDQDIISVDLNGDGTPDRIRIVDGVGVGIAAGLSQLRIELSGRFPRLKMITVYTHSFSPSDLCDIDNDGNAEILIRTYISSNVLETVSENRGFLVNNIIDIRDDEICFANGIVQGYPSIMEEATGQTAILTADQRAEILGRVKL